MAEFSVYQAVVDSSIGHRDILYARRTRVDLPRSSKDARPDSPRTEHQSTRPRHERAVVGGPGVCVGACEKPDGADQARRGSQAKEEAWNHHPSVGIGARWVGQRRGSPNQGRSAVDEVAVWLHTSERDGGEEPTQEEGSNRKAGQNGRSDHWVLLYERWALRRGSRRPCLYRARHGEDGMASRRRKSAVPDLNARSAADPVAYSM